MKIKERELQEKIRDDVNMTELFRAVIVDVNPVWFDGKWIKNQAASGMSDLLVLCKLGNRAFLLEVKREGKKLTPNQIEFRDMCRENNISYHVVRSSKEALIICQERCARWDYIDRRLEAILVQL